MRSLTNAASLRTCVCGCSVAASIVLTGCGILDPYVTIYGQRAIQPPPEYAVWYAEAETCLGMHGDYHAVRWFVAERIMIDGRDVTAVTIGDRITITSGGWPINRQVVGHEIVHHIDPSIPHTGINLPCELGH